MKFEKSDISSTESSEAIDFQKFLKDYLELEDKDVERIELLEAKNLPEHYKIQYEALGDKRLENVTIAIIPDDLWVKGSQPSESHAEKQLILFREDYFENSDEAAWTTHELAHCKKFLDSDSQEVYQRDMKTFAFEDIESEYAYPNNKAEEYTFTEQFKYLKEQGKTR